MRNAWGLGVSLKVWIGLDAVLCEPVPLQGCSEPEARRYREVELGL